MELIKAYLLLSDPSWGIARNMSCSFEGAFFHASLQYVVDVLRKSLTLSSTTQQLLEQELFRVTPILDLTHLTCYPSTSYAR
jgi:hypothetical protein